MPEYERLFVQVTPEQKSWLEEQAKAEDRSVAWIVRRLIDKAKEVEHGDANIKG